MNWLHMALPWAILVALAIGVIWLEGWMTARIDAQDATTRAQRKAEAELVESKVAGLWVNRAGAGVVRPAAPEPEPESRGRPWPWK
jgi:hypothetical protein